MRLLQNNWENPLTIYIVEVNMLSIDSLLIRWDPPRPDKLPSQQIDEDNDKCQDENGDGQSDPEMFADIVIRENVDACWI